MIKSDIKQQIMRRQTQINNIKSYSGHLKRLINIRGKFNPKEVTQPQHESLSTSKHKSVRSRRYLTQQNQSKKQKVQTNRIPLTLPLVGLKQRQLLSKSLSVRKIPHRDAQIVLQNYLLSKRLLKAKPSINKIEQDKDYQKHQRYSLLRSKSKLEEIKLSQSRILRFKEFEIAQRRKLSSRLNSTLGSGKYMFTIKINSFQRVHKKEDKMSLYNLIMKLGKRSYTFKHLTLKALTESRSFYFRKRDLKFPNLLFGYIDQVIQTNCIKIGNFSIDLNEVYQKLNNLQKDNDFKYQKQDEVEGIRTIRSQLLIGTIAFNYSICRTKQ